MTASVPPTKGVALAPSAQMNAAAREPISVAISLPPERPDYTGDLLGGAIGVFGALLGAFVAYWFGSRAERKARAADERARDLFISFAVVHQLNKIYAAQDSIYQHILPVKIAHKPAPNRHISMAVSGFANTPERVHLSPDEIYRVGRIAGKEVLNALMVIDGQHNTTMELVDVYRSQKLDFRVATSSPVYSGENGIVTYEWSKAEYLKIQPILYVMDLTVEALFENSQKDRESAFNAIVAIVQARAQKFGDKSEYEVRNLDGKTVIITATEVKVASEASGVSLVQTD